MRTGGVFNNSLNFDVSVEDHFANNTAQNFFTAQKNDEPLLKQEDQTEASFGIVRKARRFSQDPTYQDYFDNHIVSGDNNSIIVGG